MRTSRGAGGGFSSPSRPRANLIAARANVERSRATVEDTRQKYERARQLASQRLLPQSELETAKANYDGAVAQLKASEAAVSQAKVRPHGVAMVQLFAEK